MEGVGGGSVCVCGGGGRGGERRRKERRLVNGKYRVKRKRTRVSHALESSKNTKYVVIFYDNIMHLYSALPITHTAANPIKRRQNNREGRSARRYTYKHTERYSYEESLIEKQGKIDQKAC